MMKRYDVVDVVGALVCLGIVAFAILWWIKEIGDFLIKN